MTTLVLGATGATGRLAVKELINAGESVKVLVRSEQRFYQFVPRPTGLIVQEAEITHLTQDQWQEQLAGVTTVISCLGHAMTAKGLFGHPRRLVSDTVVRIHKAIQKLNPSRPIKYILMNTSGAINPDINEQHTFGESLIIGTLRLLLPPHADNEDAANYLRSHVGPQDPSLNWVIVRPDNLIDLPEVTTYSEEPSPIRSPIFNAGQTSRINVANFMSRLVIEQITWQQWQGKTPVLYNAQTLSS